MIAGLEQSWFARYQPLRTLGEGSYGRVLEARDRTTGEHVALKELHHVNADSIVRFKREFRAVQETLHPNLVRLDALFEHDGRWLIAMELIEGEELLSYLRSTGGSPFDEEAIRSTFVQLAEGLSALHGAGLLHRDLKPSNVRVTPEGRVVLLDFGLATAADPIAQSTQLSPVGTIAYMAPEQADGDKLGPAADWYAFGVCLYEALTGRLPIESRMALTLLIAKRQQRPLAASVRCAAVPADLDELCRSLLEVDPRLRPTGAHVSKVLRRATMRSSRAPRPPDADVLLAFEGREPELDELTEAFRRVEAGGSGVVLVEGESGIGKSALVESFTHGIGAEALVLSSRCYENELLAYKALDGAVDELARHLKKMEPAALARVLPPRAALLCQLFPVLAAVHLLTEVSLRGLPADPSAQRLEAFAVFARLLGLLSTERPIVLAIDDLQWADAESFRLLRALLESPHTGRILIVATVRKDEELGGDAANGVRGIRELGGCRTISLRGLPKTQANTLARRLLGPLIPEPWVNTIVQESDGHPLFLTVLARFAESQDPRTAMDLTLDAAIGARVGSTSRLARSLLETAAIFASPVATSLCGTASAIPEGALGRVVAELCEARLLRRRGAGEIACFHDRVRRVVVQPLAQAQTRELHSKVASVLAQQERCDPTRLARHYEGAGELQKASESYRIGADRALAVLAFARAESLYGRALDLGRHSGIARAERIQLGTARAHALARGGRSAEAAQVYSETAEEAEGDERIRLRMWQAQHLLQSAQVEPGMQAARDLLREVGLSMPESKSGVIASLLWDRACLSMSGINVHRKVEKIAPLERMQLDALWGLAQPVAWLDPLTSAGMSTQHLRKASALGDPAHVARALGEEAFSRVLERPNGVEADRLLLRARELSDQVGDPALDVSVAYREATVATFRWNLPRARERLEHAQRVGTEQCPDQPWLLTNVRTTLLGVWAHGGEHAQLEASSIGWLSQARDRNDQFALGMLEGLGYGFLPRLMNEKVDEARHALTAALAPWPREPFSFAHFGELIAAFYVERYAGGDAAYRWFERERLRLAKAFVLRTGLGRTVLLMFRAFAALGACSTATAEQRVALLARAKADARVLGRLKMVLATLGALSLDAQIAALEGRLDHALEQARTARERGDALASRWQARSAEYLEGLLQGGDEGRKKQASALAFLSEQGWAQPRRAVALSCPVVDVLEANG